MFTQSASFSPRVTERKNPLSHSLDGSLSATAFLKVLQSCDSQIYSGFEDYDSMFDNGIIYQILRVSDMIAQMLNNDGLVISMGCGTSGRIAYLVSKRYQDLLSSTNIDYICAAGDSALLLSDEMPEDDPLLGIQDVNLLIRQRECKSAYVIGITCGLSAPYVAGPIVMALAQSSEYKRKSSPSRRRSSGSSKSMPSTSPQIDRKERNDGDKEKVSLPSVPIGAACIGFNPISDARHIPLRGVHSVEGHNCSVDTFRDLMEYLSSCIDDDSSNGGAGNGAGNGASNGASSTKHALINPVLGPEPVTGSSRMKGGSATMVLLDIMMLKGVHQARATRTTTTSNGTTTSGGNNTSGDGNAGGGGGGSDSDRMKEVLSLGSLSVSDLLLEYQRVHSHTYYSAQDHLPAIMHSAGESIRSGGRLLYVGCGSAGALGCIDASEMPDTYGDSFESIRGFVHGGWGSGTLNTPSSTPTGAAGLSPTGLGNREGDLSASSSLHRIGFDAFERDILPSLTRKDHVVLLICDPLGGADPGRQQGLDDLQQLLTKICDRSSKVSLLVSAGDLWSTLMGDETFAGIVRAVTKSCSSNGGADTGGGGQEEAEEDHSTAWMACPGIVYIPSHRSHVGYNDYSLKVLTNAISTYAQAYGRGALYHSMMISAGPANDKIYSRCVHIIASTVGITMISAEVALICSIHQVDWHRLGVDQRRRLIYMSREEHIKQSIPSQQERGESSSIVPIAVLLAGGSRRVGHRVEDILHYTGSGHDDDYDGMSYEKAAQLVRTEPNLKALLEQYVFNTGKDRDKGGDGSNSRNGGVGSSGGNTTTSTDLLPPLAELLGLPRGAGDPPASPATIRETSKTQPGFDPGAYCVSVDLGGTNIRAGIVYLPTGRLLTLHKQPLPTRVRTDPNMILDIIETLYTTCIQDLSSWLCEEGKRGGASNNGNDRRGRDGGEEEEAAIRKGQICLAIGQPGHVDGEGSIGGLAAFPGWGPFEPFPLRGYLSMVLERGLQPSSGADGDGDGDGDGGASNGQRVFVYDDANSALQAEVSYGIARLEPGPVVMVTVGTGVGMAVYLPGWGVLKGHRGLMEGGHTIILAPPPMAPGESPGEGSKRTLDRRCQCGQYGCLESFASGSALELLSEVHAEGKNSDTVLQSCAKYLSVGILNAIRHYDPSMVIIGGGMAPLLYPYILPAYRSLQWDLYDDLGQGPGGGGVDICLGQYEEAGVLGAAAMMREEQREQREQREAVRRSREREGDGSSRRGAEGKCILRTARERDRTALYRVCLLTGDAGKDATSLYTDPGLLGSIYVGPYLDEENGDRIAFALVHQRDQKEEVVGYVLAAVDTPSFHTQCEGAEGSGAWWPTLRARYGRGGEVYAGLGENEKQLVQAEIFREHRLPPSPPSGSSGNGTGSKDGEGSNEGAAALSYSAILSLYPSHLHIDITAPYQGRSYGTVMMRKILRRLQQQGSTGVHLGMHESNERAYAFYTKMGFRRLGTVGGEWILGLAF